MLKAKTITIVGLVIAGFGVVTPIAWDIWADPYELSLFVHGRTLLIQNNQGIEGLRVMYLSREIDKLFSNEISIQNTGRRLIQKEDIVKPLVVTFGEAQIFGVALKEKQPSNLEYSFKQISETQLQFDFDLLNRGEKIVFNVLTGKSPERIEGSIRAKNLSKLNIRDYEAEPPLKDKIPTHVFYVIGFALFFLVFGVRAARKEFGPLRHDAFFVNETLKAGFNKDELFQFLQQNIWHRLSDRQKTRLEEKIQNADITDEKATRDVADAITYEALNQDASGLVAIATILAVIVLIYGFVRIAIAIAI